MMQDYIDEDDLEDDPEEYEVPVSPNLIIYLSGVSELKVAAEICEDLWWQLRQAIYMHT